MSTSKHTQVNEFLRELYEAVRKKSFNATKAATLDISKFGYPGSPGTTEFYRGQQWLQIANHIRNMSEISRYGRRALSVRARLGENSSFRRMEIQDLIDVLHSQYTGDVVRFISDSRLFVEWHSLRVEPHKIKVRWNEKSEKWDTILIDKENIPFADNLFLGAINPKLSVNDKGAIVDHLRKYYSDSIVCTD